MIFNFTELPLLSSELEWMLVGKKLNEGLFLYSEIQTQTAPLAAYLYQAIDSFFGNNPLVIRIIASTLIFIQVLQFNRITNKRTLFHERHYIAGLVYLILMSMSFDLMKLSPMLLSNSFFLLGVNAILRQIERRDGIGDDIFEGGIYFGLATLFFQPAFVFIFWAILTLSLYTGITIRQVFMIVLAYILPVFIVFLFFYFNNHSNDFLSTYLFNLNNLVNVTLLSIRDILIVYTVPVAISLLGVIKVIRGQRYNSFQNRSHQAILILGIFSLVSFLLSGKYIPSNLIYFITPLAFYIAGFFIHYKKVLLPEILFITFFTIVLFISFIGAKDLAGFSTHLLKDYRVKPVAAYEQFKNKRIFITGENLESFQKNEMAMGYISWSLAKRDFENPNNYLSVMNIFNNFKKDMPEVIIDEEQVMQKVFNNIPELAKEYKETSKNIYERKTK